jgi:N-acetylglucosaminyl-diphospho-decaprenol L-rhamnosyltransferase
MSTTVEAIIVTWNSGATIDRCIESCAGMAVTVVDNASSDDTVERVCRHRNVYLIENQHNRGFAAAANQGIGRTGAEHVLLLNPDVELLGPITPLIEACASGRNAIASGRLIDANGATQTGFTVRRLPSPLTLAFEALGLNRLFPWNAVNRRYRCLDMDLKSPADVEQPAGAFLLFNRQLWRDLGGFDEHFYPVWFEDVDFCKRALDQGKIRYIPAVAARHQGGASVAGLDWTCRELYWYVSLLRYASKHFSLLKFRGVCGAVVLGSAGRLLTGLFIRRTFQVVTVYARTARLAARCMISGRTPDPVREQEYQQGSRVRTITSSSK